MNVCTKGKLKTRFNVHILSETPTSAMSCLILRSELSFTFSINKVWKINRKRFIKHIIITNNNNNNSSISQPIINFLIGSMTTIHSSDIQLIYNSSSSCRRKSSLKNLQSLRPGALWILEHCFVYIFKSHQSIYICMK